MFFEKEKGPPVRATLFFPESVGYREVAVGVLDCRRSQRRGVRRFVRSLGRFVDLEAVDHEIVDGLHARLVGKRDGLFRREARDEQERTGVELREAVGDGAERDEVLERAIGVLHETRNRRFAGRGRAEIVADEHQDGLILDRGRVRFVFHVGCFSFLTPVGPGGLYAGLRTIWPRC